MARKIRHEERKGSADSGADTQRGGLGFIQQPHHGKTRPNLRGEVARWCHTRGKPCLTPYTTPSETSMISEIFTALDTNKSGVLDIKELVDCVQAIRGEETLNTELLEEYARRIDSNGNGQLSLHEFTSYLGTCYLLEPPEDTNPLFIEMDEMLLKLTNPVLRDNVGKLLFNKLNSDVKLSKLFAELTPHEREEMLADSSKMPVMSKQELAAKSADKPYPSIKPFQQESNSLKRRAKFIDSLDPSKTTRELYKAQLLRYRTTRKGFATSRPGAPESATGEGKTASGAPETEAATSSTVAELLARRGSLTPAEAAKISMLMQSDSSDMSLGGLEYPAHASPEPGNASEDMPLRDDAEAEILAGRVLPAAPLGDNPEAAGEDGDATKLGVEGDDVSEAGTEGVDICWDSAPPREPGARDNAPALVAGAEYPPEGLRDGSGTHAPPPVGLHITIPNPSVDSVAATLAGVRSLADPTRSAGEPLGRVLHVRTAPKAYARDHYATDVREVTRILERIDEMVTPPFSLNGPHHPSPPPGIPGAVNGHRARSVSSPVRRPSHFRVRRPADGETAARSQRAAEPERVSAARAAGWTSSREVAPPFRKTRPTTAPVRIEWDRSNGVAAEAGDARGGASTIDGPGRSEQHTESPSDQSGGRYPFLTVDAHLQRHGFEPVGGRDAVLSASSCYSRRRYFTSPGPQWRGSKLPPSASASVDTRRRGVYARELSSSTDSYSGGVQLHRPYTSSARYSASGSGNGPRQPQRPQTTTGHRQRQRVFGDAVYGDRHVASSGSYYRQPSRQLFTSGDGQRVARPQSSSAAASSTRPGLPV